MNFMSNSLTVLRAIELKMNETFKLFLNNPKSTPYPPKWRAELGTLGVLLIKPTFCSIHNTLTNVKDYLIWSTKRITNTTVAF